MTEREFDQASYLDEIRSFSNDGQDIHLSGELMIYMAINSLDPRMVSYGGFEVYEHLESCGNCGDLLGELCAKGY